MYIGNKVKDLRKEKGLTLKQLSEASGVQIATLSRIEHQKMTGTLESHMKIAKALDVELTDLYSNIVEDEQSIEIHTPNSKTDMFVHTDKSSYEILTNKVLSKKMMPVLLKIEPQGKTNMERNQAGSEKFIYVLDGQIEVNIGGVLYPLSKNNSLYFDASTEHFINNNGSKLAKIFCVTTPVAL